MAKFYVQSGTMRSMVLADTSGKAALWAVHQAMQQILPLDDDDEAPGIKRERISDRGVVVLSGTVSISERGFDRDDAISLATMEVVAQWNQMVTTLDRLEKMLYRSAA